MLFFSGCATTASGPVAITKVNPYHLHDAPDLKASDPMIQFEQRRFVFGAVEEAEIKERFGNYYSIFWKTESRSAVTVRLEYRQGKTGNTVHVKETTVTNPKRTNVTKFEIAGAEYRDLGKVTQWRASIIENGTEVAEYKSYLWQ